MIGHEDFYTELLRGISGKGPYDEFRTSEELVRTRATALILLKDLTGQDFGFDVAAWRAWLEKNLDNLDESQTPAAQRGWGEDEDDDADDEVKTAVPLFTPEEQAWFDQWEALEKAYHEKRIQIAMGLLSRYEQWLHNPQTQKPMKAVYPPDPLMRLSPAERRRFHRWRAWREGR